ncbi:MAG TPA: hypothetical protein VK627_01815 [Edaphobacter sp.]|nr:hypothetical protein [Edaphobacter sp.]
MRRATVLECLVPQSIESLSEHSQRHPTTPEDQSLRHILYGNKPHLDRILYSIDLHARPVNVIHIRHHARDAFKPRQPLQSIAM